MQAFRRFGAACPHNRSLPSFRRPSARLRCERYNRSGKRLLLRVDDRTVCSVPPQWTDSVAPDPEVGMRFYLGAVCLVCSILLAMLWDLRVSRRSGCKRRKQRRTRPRTLAAIATCSSASCGGRRAYYGSLHLANIGETNGRIIRSMVRAEIVPQQGRLLLHGSVENQYDLGEITLGPGAAILLKLDSDTPKCTASPSHTGLPSSTILESDSCPQGNPARVILFGKCSSEHFEHAAMARADALLFGLRDHIAGRADLRAALRVGQGRS